jgi:C4-dicarboxylate transporter DctQ subunit
MDRSEKSKKARQITSTALNRVNTATRVFEEAALIAGMSALAVLLVVDVVAREFWKSLYYSEELSQFLVIFTTFAGLGYGVRKARHIRMAAIYDLMNERVQKILVYLMAGLSLVIMFVFAYLSVIYVAKVARLGQTTPALRWPYWIIVVITPLGFFLAGVQYVLTVVKNILRKKEVWLSPEQQSEYDE